MQTSLLKQRLRLEIVHQSSTSLDVAILVGVGALSLHQRDFLPMCSILDLTILISFAYSDNLTLTSPSGQVDLLLLPISEFVPP